MPGNPQKTYNPTVWGHCNRCEERRVDDEVIINLRGGQREPTQQFSRDRPRRQGDHKHGPNPKWGQDAGWSLRRLGKWTQR